VLLLSSSLALLPHKRTYMSREQRNCSVPEAASGRPHPVMASVASRVLACNATAVLSKAGQRAMATSVAHRGPRVTIELVSDTM
jgi:hypothetical protein